MLNKLLIKKTAVFMVLFFSFFIFQNTFNYSNEEDILRKARLLIIEGNLTDAITELTRIINRLENIVEKKKKVAEAYYLLARVHFDGGDNNKFDESIRMVYKLYPEYKTNESNFEFKEQVENIKNSMNLKTKSDKKVVPENKIKKQYKQKSPPKKVITKIGKKKKKKKFPILLVLISVAAIVTAVVLLGGKKESTPPPTTTDKGSITVESVPDGASIWLDGSDSGLKTNSNLDNLSTGSHTIKLVKEGYFDYSTTVTVVKDQQSNVSTSLIKGFEWISISAGNFQMGDNFNEGYEREKPVHEIYLDTYSISKNLVTFEHYDQFCEDTNRNKPSDNGWGRDSRPVINVNWSDANDYCDWIYNKTGQSVKLPTEAQWEKAARGTDQRKYPWGNGDPNSSLCNYLDNVGGTMPVGSFPAGASPYGVLDMAGNVWEWCSDWYGENYYSISPSSNPDGPLSGSTKAKRGGSWYSNIFDLRTANRSFYNPSNGLGRIGFRLMKAN